MGNNIPIPNTDSSMNNIAHISKNFTYMRMSIPAVASNSLSVVRMTGVSQPKEVGGIGGG